MVVQWDDEEQGSDRWLGFTFAESELILRLQFTKIHFGIFENIVSDFEEKIHFANYTVNLHCKIAIM